MSEDDPEYEVDFREHPEAYEVGRGEQGAFKVQPYKGELLSLWGIADLDAAEEGAAAIYERYREYRDRGEFPGMDMARKYLQMGWTRAMRYAKYPGGRKYREREAQSASNASSAEQSSADHSSGRSPREDGETASSEDGERVEREPREWYDEEKREIALVYKQYLDRVREDEAYRRMREAHEERYG